MAFGVKNFQFIFQDYENPEIKITYLRKENDIYWNEIRTFIRKDVEDLKIKSFVDWFFDRNGYAKRKQSE